MHEVGNQHDLGGPGECVIADEQKPPVARQILESIDIDPAEIDDGTQPVGNPEDRCLQGLHPSGLIDDAVDVATA